MSSKKSHILVVDDDTRIRELIGKFLNDNGFKAFLAKDPPQAREIMNSSQIDLLIIDVMMKSEDGITFTKKIRINSKVPIIILSAKGGTESRLEGLESGADDYVSKPFEPKELMLRIKNILKRTEELYNHLFKFGPFVFDLEKLNLKKEDDFIYLTQQEAKFLELLCINHNKSVSRNQFCIHIGDIEDRSIDVQINRLRKKIENDPKKPQFIQTIRNKGYQLSK